MPFFCLHAKFQLNRFRRSRATAVKSSSIFKEMAMSPEKEKVLQMSKHYLEAEIKELKGYSNNVDDDIIVGKKKRYVSLNQKKAQVWFRMRANIIDPAPREPYSSVSIWKCKWCDERDQSTEHYVRKCNAIKEETFENLDRGSIFRSIQTLEGDDQTFVQITGILTKLYRLINK